ncbi:hypothetical protein D9M69_689470 [compost metagenome]
MTRSGSFTAPAIGGRMMFSERSNSAIRSAAPAARCNSPITSLNVPNALPTIRL